VVVGAGKEVFVEDSISRRGLAFVVNVDVLRRSTLPDKFAPSPLAGVFEKNCVRLDVDDEFRDEDTAAEEDDEEYDEEAEDEDDDEGGNEGENEDDDADDDKEDDDDDDDDDDGGVDDDADDDATDNEDEDDEDDDDEDDDDGEDDDDDEEEDDDEDGANNESVFESGLLAADALVDPRDSGRGIPGVIVGRSELDEADINIPDVSVRCSGSTDLLLKALLCATWHEITCPEVSVICSRPDMGYLPFKDNDFILSHPSVLLTCTCNERFLGTGYRVDWLA